MKDRSRGEKSKDAVASNVCADYEKKGNGDGVNSANLNFLNHFSVIDSPQ